MSIVYFDLELVENVVDVVEALDVVGRLLVQEVDLVIEFVQVFEESSLGDLAVHNRARKERT